MLIAIKKVILDFYHFSSLLNLKSLHTKILEIVFIFDILTMKIKTVKKIKQIYFQSFET